MNLPALAALAMVAFVLIGFVILAWLVIWLHHRLLDAETALSKLQGRQSVNR